MRVEGHLETMLVLRACTACHAVEQFETDEQSGTVFCVVCGTAAPD